VDATVEEGPGYQRLRRRRIILLAVVAVVVVLAAGGVALSTQIKSPAQQAAETKPPALTSLSATVTKQVITSTVLAQGSVGTPPEVSPSSIGGAAGPSAGTNVQAIVTRIFRRTGQQVGQGSVILDVAGQPFFVLQGTVPAYRDLVPGEKGEDVTQLQDDLETLGYGIGSDTLGTYGAGTAAAVASFYTAMGYQAPTAAGGTGKKAGNLAEVPLGDFMFVPRLPAHIAKLSAKVGQSISGSDLVLSLGHPSLAGQLNPTDRGLVRPGMRVIITRSDTGQTYPGKIKSISSVPSSTNSIAGGDYLPMKIRPLRPLPAVLIGQNVSLRIATAATSAPVLAVPEAAVFASANGGIYVTRLEGSTEVRVEVRVGATGNGMVQVTPVHAGALGAGDRVLIGANYTNPVVQIGNSGRHSFQSNGNGGPGGPTKVQVGGP
jgi:peptidoglycan hydrolase-like protein with peptidoglycan-binding domain